MKKPPENLTLGHATAYVLLYVAKYNDGESRPNEFHEILKSMKYWMGSDVNAEEIKKILIETDEWFTSGSNFERTNMLDNIIILIFNSSGENKSIVREVFEDCVRLCASNNDRYRSILNNDTQVNEDLLKKLFQEFPLLTNIKRKFKIDN